MLLGSVICDGADPISMAANLIVEGLSVASRRAPGHPQTLLGEGP